MRHLFDVAGQGDHQGGLGAAVDLVGRSAAGVLAGLVRKTGHPHV
jgi:hypothetical protein